MIGLSVKLLGYVAEITVSSLEARSEGGSVARSDGRCPIAA